MNRFRENILILGPNMPHLPRLGHNKNFSQKKGFFLLTSSKKSQKRNAPILRERRYRQTDGLTDKRTKRVEFKGPSGRAVVQ